MRPRGGRPVPTNLQKGVPCPRDATVTEATASQICISPLSAPDARPDLPAWVDRACDGCGAPIRVPRDQVRKGHGRYCSVSCASRAPLARQAADELWAYWPTWATRRAARRMVAA